MMRELLLIAILAGCASAPEVYGPRELSRQILVVESGKKGLTTRSCKRYKEPTLGEQIKGQDPTCLEFETISYDLEDASIRQQLRELDFVCRVGSDYYQVAPDQPAICTRTFTSKCWLCPSKKSEGCINQDEQERLRNGRTVCYNRKAYPNFRGK